MTNNPITLTASMPLLTGIDLRKLLLRAGVNPNRIDEDAMRDHMNSHHLDATITDDMLGTIASNFRKAS